MNAKPAPAYSALHQQLLDQILAATPAKLSADKRQFVEHFYAMTPVSDLEEMEPAKAMEVALAFEQFAHTRKGHAPKLEATVGKSKRSGRSRSFILAINDDMPFLVDSLSNLITQQGLGIHRILHPILAVKRNAKGELTDTARHDKAPASWSRESYIYIECSPLPVSLTPAALVEEMHATFDHVAHAVADWKPMRQRAEQLIAAYKTKSSSLREQEQREIHDLLEWLASNHFIFLGLADYVPAKGGALALDTASALGIYRISKPDMLIERRTQATCHESIRVLKASEMSRVHRGVFMDYITLKREDGSETRLLGLFTSSVYYRETSQIPFIRRKAEHVLERAGFNPHSHSGKALKTALEFLPRDELFQMDEESLFRMAMRIVSLEAHPQLRLFIRHDPFERFISAMAYIPREQFSTSVREEIARMLERTYQGRFRAFYTQITEAPLVRLTILVETNPGTIPAVDESLLEQQVKALASRWSDALRDAIFTRFGIAHGEPLAQSYANAFPPAYINTHSAQAAAFDIRRLQECAIGDGLALELYRAKGSAPDELHLKCFSRDLRLELSNIIPVLEHMGCTVVDATPYIIAPLAPLPPILLRDFTLRVGAAATLDIDSAKARIEDAIEQIWRGQVDNDQLNALVFSTSLSARELSVLRAYSRYLQQIDFPYSQPFIAQALGAHAATAAQLAALFTLRFDPAVKKRDEKYAECKAAIEAALEQVSNLSEDRVIRALLALIDASLRTNFYQTDAIGAPKSYLSIKLRSRLVPNMPLPVPYAEIFVTSQRVEGIHLRGGTVARGGLRWSDRPEDFRTEVLGLVKAQMVKNAVIVPQGAKGGFILRKPPAERDAFMAEGIECYKTFLRGLLDITDNIVAGKLTPPSQTVRHDGDDPYLVVAADKGTATFSDTANGVAAEYDFWLGDAFASGGSAGYDHKVMAITARGAWVSVERHFREMGKNIDSETFTAIGVGDMSGDVFGNGMLLSPNMRLVAGFNHRHIFLDPTPNEKTSFAERQRLFALPRSGWNDYNAKLISKGGGVFERSAKSIKLTPEIKTALGTDVGQATPDELIKLILKAPVDLLWNGGIGTYVKAGDESHEQVGDRTNNALRVDGRELRCKIVGEGGNLGFTQKGRIEYARAGGRINTDAIDNSGGVDCSDHEVNIKIAMNAALQAGKTTRTKRDALLKKMTEEVAQLVLIDNKLQTQAISIAQLQGPAILEPAEQLIAALESTKFLNRKVEFLPDARAFGELHSSKSGLTRPEIAVLLAYAKMALSLELKESKLLDAPYFEQDLLRYFPKALAKPYGEELSNHRLRRDIVATMITNSIVNRTGFYFAHHLMRATGLAAEHIALAYIATRDAFNLRALWKDIEALDGRVDAQLQSRLFSRVSAFIEHSCRWFLTNVAQPLDVQTIMDRYAAGIALVERHAEELMTETLRKSYQQSLEELLAQGIPEPVATRIAKLEVLSSACDIIDLAHAAKWPVEMVGKLYFDLGAQLKLGWLRRSAFDLSGDNYWQQLAIKSLLQELYQAQRRMTAEIIQRYGKRKDQAVDFWAINTQEPLKRYLGFIEELRTQQSLDYAMLIVALRQVQWIVSQ